MEDPLEVVNVCPPQHIDAFFSHQPEQVNHRGWCDNTPLHKAAIRGDLFIIGILLKYKPDINARNSNGETPVLLSCRRGNPSALHLLIQNGADIQSKDNNARNAMHYATLGNSAMAMQYLRKYQGFNLESQDVNGQSPLHLACQHNCYAALEYLVKEKVNFLLLDGNSNNCLHLIAKFMNVDAAWLVIFNSSRQLLHMRNKEGQTPLAIVENELLAPTHHINKELLLPFLRKETNHSDKYGRPQGPTFLWYWLAFWPFTGYTALIVLSNLFSGSWRGVFVIVGLLYLIRTIYRQTHRIDHEALWANPVQAGCFAAGMVYSILVSYIVLFPGVHDSWWIKVPSIAMTAVIVCAYPMLLKQDPGRVKPSTSKANGSPSTLMEMCEQSIQSFENYCVDCELVRPSRAKHCKICEVCIDEFDHHCLFLMKCIGKENHWLFVVFVFSSLTCMTLFLVACCLYLTARYPSLSTGSLLYACLESDVWVLSMVILNIASFVWGVNLLRTQLASIALGCTYYEQLTHRISGLPIPSCHERLRNVTTFLLRGEKQEKIKAEIEYEGKKYIL